MLQQIGALGIPKKNHKGQGQVNMGDGELSHFFLLQKSPDLVIISFEKT